MTNEAVTKAYADRASAHTVMQIEHAKRNALDVFVYRLREFFGNAVTRTVTERRKLERFVNHPHEA